MRVLDTIDIVELDEYRAALSHNRDDEPKKLALYGVVLTTPWGTETRYVLAESEDGAIAQARCVAKIQRHRISNAIDALVYATARRLPVLMQGWGEAQF